MAAFILLTSTLLQGCAVGPYRLQYLWQSEDEPELSYYVDKATAIEYPVEEDSQPTDPDLFVAPRTIRSLDEVSPREISLNECIQQALQTATIILSDGALGSPGNQVLAAPDRAPSIFDVAIQDTNFLFGNRGLQAALTDFDAQLTSSITWGRNEVPQNLANAGIGAGQSLVQETMAWTTRLEKTMAHGGTVSLQGDTNYDGNNRGTGIQAYSSSYNGLFQAEYRQPLWAGAGTEFTRTAGPRNRSLSGVSGVAQGILIARINNDISLTQFEQSVTSLVRDVEQRYWDLDLALRLYASEKDAFEQLVTYLNILDSRGESGVPRLQAQARIYEADARLRGSLADVLDAEARLRRLCHMPLNDGKFLYPSDAPVEGQVVPEWESSIQEALSHRVELRRQKWEIKSLQLQLKAARNLTQPELDMVSQYRRNALGDRFIGGGDTFGNDLFGGQNEGWNIGFQVRMPIGLRLAHDQVRNYEIRLRKARVVLGEQEREIAHELRGAMLNMQRWYELADSTTRRIDTSKKYVIASRDLVLGNDRANSELFNLLLQAQIQQRDAEQAYMRSIIEYNKAITDMKFRKGTLLTDNEIYLAEGNWHPAANINAMQRAEARTHAKDAHKLRTSPMEFVGQPGPTGYESLGTNTRPSIPGALDPEPGLPGGEVPAIPIDGLPQFPNEPVPVPPADSTPMPMEIPPPEMPPQQSRENITQQIRSLQSAARSALAPVSLETEFKSDSSGRVEL